VHSEPPLPHSLCIGSAQREDSRLVSPSVHEQARIQYQVPDTHTAIANGIRDRHNIVTVRRTTVWKDCGGLADIQALKTAILDFAGNIDAQAKSLSSSLPSPVDPIEI
jgi:hypothetical protein